MTEDELQQQLDDILTEFLVYTIGNKAVEASPEYARNYAHKALTTAITAQTREALTKLKRYDNAYYTHITGMESHYQSIHAVPTSVIDTAIAELQHTPSEEKE